jgi:hypothetical protein
MTSCQHDNCAWSSRGAITWEIVVASEKRDETRKDPITRNAQAMAEDSGYAS